MSLRSSELMGLRYDRYDVDTDGGLPLHDHTFDHAVFMVRGKAEISDGNGRRLVVTPDSDPVLFRAGKKHAIRALVDGTTFINIMPLA